MRSGWAHEQEQQSTRAGVGQRPARGCLGQVATDPLVGGVWGPWETAMIGIQAAHICKRASNSPQPLDDNLKMNLCFTIETSHQLPPFCWKPPELSNPPYFSPAFPTGDLQLSSSLAPSQSSLCASCQRVLAPLTMDGDVVNEIT